MEMIAELDAGRCLLACATGDGGVHLINISQKLQLRGGSDFLTTYELDSAFERATDVVCAPDKCAVTALEWIAVPGRNVRNFSLTAR